MVLDYRNTRFSFRQLRRRRRRRRLRWAGGLVLAALLVLITLRTVQHRRLEHLQAELLQGRPGAAAVLEKGSRPLFTTTAMAELHALSHLLAGRLGAGERILRSCGHSGAVDSIRFLDRLVDLGRYAALGSYLDFLDRHGTPHVYHRVLYWTARYRPDEARRSAASLGPEARGRHAKALRILEGIWKELDTGRIACIRDHAGRVAGEFLPATGTVASRVPGLDLSPFAAQLQQGLRFFTLSLDTRLQQEVHRIFGPFHGSCVILNPVDDAILAAYSKPVPPAAGNTAWQRAYEPGSVIKVLTYLAFIQSPDPRLFPMECRGNISLDGTVFYDWTRHGRVDSPETALAVSCNVAYARMGIAAGGPRLARVLTAFRFNSPALTDRFLEFRLGDFSPPPLPPPRLANLAVGLEEIHLTTLHGALLASALSQSGTLASPYLIATEKNILKLGIYHHVPAVLARIPGGRAFEQLRDAMVRVIRDPRGTGRRARLNGAPDTAAKTGTAGSPAQGLDAIMIAFHPASRTRYALAFRLERGGKAELNGARVLQSLLSGPLARVP